MHMPRKGQRYVARPTFFPTRRPASALMLLVCAAVFGALAGAQAQPTAAQAVDQGQYSALRVYGSTVVSNPNHLANANRAATAGDNLVVDPLTGLIPEDPPYTDPDGPFDPHSSQAPERDIVTWNPAWISERLGDRNLRASWPGLTGIDEVSRASNIRASSVNASQKVWLRHWYEPTHLDLDLNADGRLTDANNDGIPDARMNPSPSATDEWYPAIMAELTYMLVENDPLPQSDPAARDLHRSAPRPTCGAPRGTSMVFPVGTSIDATDPTGPAVGHGLTSLDADFDGRLDMVRVTDEASLPASLGGLRMDFDGDGMLDRFDSDGIRLSCDEMVVLHTESLILRAGQKAQFLDHFIELGAVSNNGAVLDVWNNYGLTPRLIQSRALGIGGALLAGDTGPLLTLAPGGDNLGRVPPGAWFAYLVDADADDDSAIVILGRALGAPCASMQSAPLVSNRSAGGPWFLKRFYVDGHEYNVGALTTCPSGDLESITLRAPIPKVDVTIEQHSVRLQGYAIEDPRDLPWLPLPPPFNHEHTVLEDVLALDAFDDLDPQPASEIQRPRILYMGGPIGPMAPVLSDPAELPYRGRLEGGTEREYNSARESRWSYVHETTNPAMSGQIRERLAILPRVEFLPDPGPPRDFGDAPSSLGYPTLLDDEGARHQLGPDGPVLGSCVDGEADGQPNIAATGDDAGPCDGDDDNGIALLSPVQQGITSDLRLNTSASSVGGRLSAWIDFNRDGDWDDLNEQILTDVLLFAGSPMSSSHLFQTPDDAVPGPTYLRLRFSSQAGLSPYGSAPDGEVEDYRIEIAASSCPYEPIDAFTFSNNPQLNSFAVVDGDAPGPLVINDMVGLETVIGGTRRVTLGPYTGGGLGQPLNMVMSRINSGQLEFVANPDSQANLELNYDSFGAGLGADFSSLDRIRMYYIFDDSGIAASVPVRITLDDGTNTAVLTELVAGGNTPFVHDFELANFTGIGSVDLSNLFGVRFEFMTASAQDFVLDQIKPCLGELTTPTPTATMTPGAPRATETPRPGPTLPPTLPNINQDCFFYNEQVLTLPRHYTEFLLPDAPATAPDAGFDPDRYLLTSAFSAPTARWRRWQMPDVGVPDKIPPVPPDLLEDVTTPLGAPRRASFWFDPDTPGAQPVKLWLNETGVRLYGGLPDSPGLYECDRTRPSRLAGAGNRNLLTDRLDDTRPVEVLPYSDPFAPFSSQHPDAPRGDILSVNPAYMDEFRNSGEPLAALYRQLSQDGQNAREKAYHRIWYEPWHISKIRFARDCGRDLGFPALMQEYSFLYLDTNDQPLAVPAGRSRFGFPIGTRAEELPKPLANGNLPPGGEFGYGLTTFDANFDGQPDAVTIHSEETLDEHLDTAWQSMRPRFPGLPPAAITGPSLDFDGDGILDELDQDNFILSGDEMVVLAVEDLVLDLDANTPAASAAMFLDHMISVENVTRGQRAQVRFWFTGGNGTDSRPAALGGTRSLDVGDAVIVDRFQDRITVVHPGEQNPGVDGAWFVYLKDVSTDRDQITIAIGRALGAARSAIDDGAGNHDLLPGDPWYLKRFYVDGHEYDTVALMVLPGVEEGEEDLFKFITLRTPVPIGSFFNTQDTLMLQGYFEGDLPDQASVLPPFNVDHTIMRDYERQEAEDFAHTRRYDECVGDIAPFGPLSETLVDASVEPRYSSELREIRENRQQGEIQRRGATWQTDQSQVVPDEYAEVRVSAGQIYLYTSNWTSPATKLHFYGCLRDELPRLPGQVDLSQLNLANIAARWGLPPGFIPAPNELNPAQPDAPVLDGGLPIYARYYDAALGADPVRVKLFYDPEETMNDIYVNRGRIPWGVATVTLGNTVWMDGNRNGLFEPGLGEPGIPGVEVRLYLDSDSSGDYTPGVDELIRATLTDDEGIYSFGMIVEGDYIVLIPAQEFQPGKPLYGKESSLGSAPAPDPNDDQDDDDNGAPIAGGDVASSAIQLRSGSEPGGDGDINDTLDLGFQIPPPTATPTASNTPPPSSTPLPTATSTPTDTPTPTATSTPTLMPTMLPDEPPVVCLGDLVWLDIDDDGRYEPTAGERGIAGVRVMLYLDSDGNNAFTPAIDQLRAVTTTDANGSYIFCELIEGDYVVVIPGSNFEPGGPLAGGSSSLGNMPAPDPDDDVDDDDNGQPLAGGNLASLAITLKPGTEPIDDGDDDPSTNRTLDFGIILPPPTPSPTPSRTATEPPTRTSTPTATFTPTLTPTPPAFGISCGPSEGDPNRLTVSWIDATNFETEFILAVSIDGGEFVPLDHRIASHSSQDSGRRYSYTSPRLPANFGARFQVKARNALTGQESSYGMASGICRTERKPAESLGCYSGRVNPQGRRDASGVWIRYDGFPVTRTDGQGNFRICGAKPGYHEISAASACYLSAIAEAKYVGAGREIRLDPTDLYGGDITGDQRINLFDMVRVGADFNNVPPRDPAADCTRDGRVDLFDLVLVGSNYGLDGPLPWAWVKPRAATRAGEGAITQAAGDPAPSIDGASAFFDTPAAALPFGAVRPQTQGPADGLPARLVKRRLDGDRFAVDVVISGAQALYGADLTMVYDPALLEVIDSQPALAGTQIKPGEIWSQRRSFIGANAVAAGPNREGQYQIRFAASLMQPAPAIWGEHVLASVTFREAGKSSTLEEPYALGGVLLSDARGQSIASRWTGFDIAAFGRLFLPWIHTGRIEDGG